mmetsp:Transcript_58261/g.161565  ORF Transcript_58261/g.161565 Transcript_58261/m.161565 type:complete len:471 (-) Transcript_58261:358-1770(-)
MRRNVRRLNREVNDGQPNNKHVVVTNAQNDPNRVVEIVVPKNTDLRDKSKAAKPGQKKTRSRRAANLAELQRYYAAAAEAAQDVLVETGNDKDDPESNADLDTIAAEGAKPLDSPSRLVALNLHSGNELFREKLKSKLEETGGLACKIQVGRTKRALPEKEVAAAEKAPQKRKRKPPPSEDVAPAKPSPALPIPPLQTGLEYPANPRTKVQLAAKLGASDDMDNNTSIDDVYALEAADAHSSTQGRKKKDLSVTISEADNFGLASMPPPAKRTAIPPPDDTPRRVSLRLQGKTPVNDEARLDSPLPIRWHVDRNSEMAHIGATTGETPHPMDLSQPGSKPDSVLSSESLKFNFDDLVNHFPSVRSGFTSTPSSNGSGRSTPSWPSSNGSGNRSYSWPSSSGDSSDRSSSGLRSFRALASGNTPATAVSATPRSTSAEESGADLAEGSSGASSELVDTASMLFGVHGLSHR